MIWTKPHRKFSWPSTGPTSGRRLTASIPGCQKPSWKSGRHPPHRPNYWERYSSRGHNRPYFLIMAPPALYCRGPGTPPEEFASETERILKVFKDQMGTVPAKGPLEPETRKPCSS